MTFVIPLGERWLYHHPLTGVTALINQAAVRALCRGGDSLPPALLALAPADVPAPPASPDGPLSPLFLGILPTRRCNIACRYCNFGAERAPEASLAVPTALTVIDWYLDLCHAQQRSLADIHFFGGEPFTALEVVETVVHYARDRASRLGLRPWFEVSTNGVFDDRCRRFVGNYFQAVVLSLDGPADIHDALRPRSDGRGTFTQVARTARALAEAPCELAIRVCVTADSVHRLGEITEWLGTAYRPAAIDFEVVKLTPESRAAGLAPPDPVVFARAFLQAERIGVALGVKTVYAAARPMGSTPRSAR